MGILGRFTDLTNNKAAPSSATGSVAAPPPPSGLPALDDNDGQDPQRKPNQKILQILFGDQGAPNSKNQGNSEANTDDPTANLGSVPQRANQGNYKELSLDPNALKKSPVLQAAVAHFGQDEVHNNGELASFLSGAAGQAINPHSTAWCAYFANAVLDAAGIKGTKSGAARSFENFGKDATNDPKAGDVVVFSRPGAGPEAGHVAFLEEIKDGKVRVIGGNQGKVGEVDEAWFPIDQIVAIRRPPDPSGTTPAPATVNASATSSSPATAKKSAATISI